eukprot:scaffold912_cov108-Isochrysis_galbana.AAC.2
MESAVAMEVVLGGPAPQPQLGLGRSAACGMRYPVYVYPRGLRRHSRQAQRPTNNQFRPHPTRIFPGLAHHFAEAEAVHPGWGAKRRQQQEQTADVVNISP